MSINDALASVPVNDLRAAEQWYEQLLGRPADASPMPEVSEWRFPGGGWLQVYESKQRAGAGSVTLAVENWKSHETGHRPQTAYGRQGRQSRDDQGPGRQQPRICGSDGPRIAH